MTHTRFFRIVAAGYLAATTVFASAQTAWADKARVLADGKEDYVLHCGPCHGPQGRGDGSMAALLVKPPTDLTQIAKRNGGAFPFWKVYEIVAGRSETAGHQSFQMPQFWERFRGEQGKPGYDLPHIRILLLTHYVEDLQER